MRADREKKIKEAVQRFIDEPDGVLMLDAAWVKQASRNCPRHLTDEQSVFTCGTNYVNKDNADGDVIKIALANAFKDCVESYSVYLHRKRPVDFMSKMVGLVTQTITSAKKRDRRGCQFARCFKDGGFPEEVR